MELKERIISWLKRNKFIFLILAVGIAFMLIPSREDVQEQVQPTEAVQRDISQELAQILSQIKGAGKVQVMLTVKSGETTVYQFDHSASGDVDTVIVTDSDRAQTGLVERVDPPEYLGAIVVCGGADSATVRLSIMEAVSKVTGLGTDRISVLKMK